MEIVFYIQTNDHFPLTPYSFSVYVCLQLCSAVIYYLFFNHIMSDSWMLLI
jgi:hypothetical protein